MALLLNGTNHYARANLTASINADAESSMTVTFKTGSVVTGVVQTVAALNTASGNYRGYKILIRTDGTIVVAYNATGADSVGSSPWLNTIASPNTLYRLVITKANGATGSVTAYIDTISNTYTRAAVASGNTLTRISLGAAVGNSPFEYFGGKVVRAAVWPSVLSTADINVCLDSTLTPASCSVLPQDYWQAVSDDAQTIGSNPLTRFNSAVYDADALTSPVINAMNGGNPVQYGQIGVPVTATLFSGLPSSGSVTHAGGTLTMSNFAGTSTSFTYDLQDRSEGIDWPLDAESCAFTFNYLTESATIIHAVSKRTSEEKLTFALADTENVNSIAHHLTLAGFTVNGGEFIFTPYSDLDFDPENDGTTDGNFTVTGEGSFTSWFRPISGLGAGNIYRYTVTVDESIGIVTINLSSMYLQSESPLFDSAYYAIDRP